MDTQVATDPTDNNNSPSLCKNLLDKKSPPSPKKAQAIPSPRSSNQDDHGTNGTTHHLTNGGTQSTPTANVRRSRRTNSVDRVTEIQGKEMKERSEQPDRP